MTTLAKALFGNPIGLLDTEFFNEAVNSRSKLPIEIPYNSYTLEDKTYVVELALAGYKKEQINIEVEDSMLIIEIEGGERDEGVNFIHQGIKSKPLLFKMQVVNGYDAENINLSYKQGILKIEIPKAKGTVKKFKL